MAMFQNALMQRLNEAVASWCHPRRPTGPGRGSTPCTWCCVDPLAAAYRVAGDDTGAKNTSSRLNCRVEATPWQRATLMLMPRHEIRLVLCWPSSYL